MSTSYLAIRLGILPEYVFSLFIIITYEFPNSLYLNLCFQVYNCNCRSSGSFPKHLFEFSTMYLN